MHFREIVEAERNKGIEQGIEQGLEQGIEQGIEAFILDKLEDNVPRETNIQRLMKRFELTQEKATEYVDKYTT